MAESEESEKTEEATPQRREDFRKRGQIAQSKELGSVLVMFATLLALWWMGRFFLDQVYQVFTRSFTDYLVVGARSEDWFMAVKFSFIKAALIVGPLGIILWLVNVLAIVLQVGFVNNEEAMKLDWNRLNPVDGFKRIFSIRAGVEGLKALLKMTLVGVVVYTVIANEVSVIPKLGGYDVESLLLYMGELFARLFGWVGLFMVGLAGLDYFFQRWDLEKKMRMTKQEVKEEIKSREGDPLIRARVRKLQREMASRRMMDDVKKADVIITNPTHIAVALRYSKEMIAPQVIAKGAGDIAERIKKRAKEFNIPIVENKPLARTIFKTLKIGQAIPRELYTAVAEVLSYIFRLKGRRVV
jgi:flagellar biosynthetic protein FlhB